MGQIEGVIDLILLYYCLRGYQNIPIDVVWPLARRYCAMLSIVICVMVSQSFLERLLMLTRD